MFSDSESSDSDSGIRFKTDSTRNKDGNASTKDNSSRRYRGSSRDRRERDRDTYNSSSHHSSHRSRHEIDRRGKSSRDSRSDRRSPVRSEPENRKRCIKKEDVKVSSERSSRSRRSEEKRYSPIKYKESNKSKDNYIKQDRDRNQISDNNKPKHEIDSSDQKQTSSQRREVRSSRLTSDKKESLRDLSISPRKHLKKDDKDVKDGSLDSKVDESEYDKIKLKKKQKRIDHKTKRHHSLSPEKMSRCIPSDKPLELKFNDISEIKINLEKNKEKRVKCLSDGECSTSNSENEINFPSKFESYIATKPDNKQETEIDNGFSRPPLPPHIVKSRGTLDSAVSKTVDSSHNKLCHVYSGPALPPHLLKTRHSSKATDDNDSSAYISSSNNSDNESLKSITCSIVASTLPKSIQSEKNIKGPIGPLIPIHIKEQLMNTVTVNENKSESSDDEIIGPLPAALEVKNAAFIKLEERALRIKMARLENNDNKDETVREEWMLQLPAAKASNLGLGPRQFRARAGPDMSDRSSWTDTPEDKARKTIEGPSATITTIDLEQEGQRNFVAKRDAEQEKLIKKHKKKHKRDESLLDIHQKDLLKKKKKAESSGASEERTRFSRDIDLKVNKFDEAQKKAIFKKAQLLDSRFSSGESKFL